MKQCNHQVENCPGCKWHYPGHPLCGLFTLQEYVGKGFLGTEECLADCEGVILMNKCPLDK